MIRYEPGSNIHIHLLYQLNGTVMIGKTNLSVKVQEEGAVTFILEESLTESTLVPGLYTYDWDTTGVTNAKEYLILYYEGTRLITQEWIFIDNIIQQQTNSIWDESLTAATYNIPTSAGRRLRSIAANVITEGEVTAATINTVSLNGDASTFDGAYDPALIAIVEGTGYGQCRGIFEYDGVTKTAVVDRNWKTIPDTSSKYVVTSWSGREHVNEGLAQGGTSNTITLNALASSNDDAYNGQLIFIRSGTGDDQVGHIIDYNGTTKVATLYHDWDEIPDSTSAYAIIPFHILEYEYIADYIWDEQISEHLTSGSTGKELNDIGTDTTSIESKVDIITTIVNSVNTVVTLVKKVLWNKKILSGASNSYVETIYDDDGVTEIRKQSITRTGPQEQTREDIP